MLFVLFWKARVLEIQANNEAQAYNVLKFEARKIVRMLTLFIKTKILSLSNERLMH